MSVCEDVILLEATGFTVRISLYNLFNSSLRTGYTRGSYDHLKEGWQKPCRAGVLSPGKTQLENCPLISLRTNINNYPEKFVKVYSGYVVGEFCFVWFRCCVATCRGESHPDVPCVAPCPERMDLYLCIHHELKSPFTCW